MARADGLILRAIIDAAVHTRELLECCLVPVQPMPPVVLPGQSDDIPRAIAVAWPACSGHGASATVRRDVVPSSSLPACVRNVWEHSSAAKTVDISLRPSKPSVQARQRGRAKYVLERWSTILRDNPNPRSHRPPSTRRRSSCGSAVPPAPR